MEDNKMELMNVENEELTCDNSEVSTEGKEISYGQAGLIIGGAMLIGGVASHFIKKGYRLVKPKILGAISKRKNSSADVIDVGYVDVEDECKSQKS